MLNNLNTTSTLKMPNIHKLLLTQTHENIQIVNIIYFIVSIITAKTYQNGRFDHVEYYGPL